VEKGGNPQEEFKENHLGVGKLNKY